MEMIGKAEDFSNSLFALHLNHYFVIFYLRVKITLLFLHQAITLSTYLYRSVVTHKIAINKVPTAIPTRREYMLKPIK